MLSHHKIKVLVLRDPHADDDDVLRKNRPKEKRFAFDNVFSETNTQSDVFDHTSKFLVDGVLDGYNATVFAYGPTGAGKTYTMLGTDTQPGLMIMTLRDLFKGMADRKEDVKFKLTMTYVEVSNGCLACVFDV